MRKEKEEERNSRLNGKEEEENDGKNDKKKSLPLTTFRVRMETIKVPPL